MDLQGENFQVPRKPRKGILYILLFLVAIFLIGYFFFLSAPAKFPVGGVITVKDGTSLIRLASVLKEEHVIRSGYAFLGFSILYQGERHLVPGDYLFKEKVSVLEVARRISEGDHGVPPVKVTIPEGFTALEISEAFAKALKNFNKENFLKLAKDREGYLFPDTYFFLSSSNEEDVLAYLESNFTKRISPYLSEIYSSGRSESEIITMASIVEGEAEGVADRALIAGILWNRVDIGMPLQADAAPETYKHAGLPSNPISNPGLAAIKAALYPEASPYLYYLHDKEGGIHFARTFEEHKANKAKYLK